MGSLAAARFPIFSAETPTEVIAVAVQDEARRGFLVQVCAWCVTGLDEALEVSHGICPECFKKEAGTDAA